MWDNYIAGSLLCTTYTLQARILYLKLVPYAVEIIGEHQRGFRRGRSTFDQIFTVRQILENCWEHNLQGVPGGNVNILGGHIIGPSKQKKNCI
jgi:hypothetical protein